MDIQSRYFYLDNDNEFERSSISNGGTFWYASELMSMLGYENQQSFRNALNKAIAICTALEIPIDEHFIQCMREGTDIRDRKLTRFACYLIVMNSDIKKPEVAAAQVYLAGLATLVKDYSRRLEEIQRVELRQDISDGERSLCSTAKDAGVEDGKGYAYFHNAGYLGMYNMTLEKIKVMKGIPSKGKLFDFINSEELAANLFRITQTEARIRNRRITGQKPCEKVARDIGQMVRDNMETKPELLPAVEDIKKVKTKIKQTNKEFKKIDKQRRNR